MKSFCLFLYVFFGYYTAFSEDVIISLTAQNGKVPVKADSIRLFNNSNGTAISFSNLPPETTTYFINLSSAQVINGISEYPENQRGISLFSNQPGILHVMISVLSREILHVTLVDLSGKTLSRHQLTVYPGNHIIEYAHNCGELSLVCFERENLRNCFKVFGHHPEGKPVILDLPTLYRKSTDILHTSPSNTRFLFSQGDSVTFTVFSTGYHPISFLKVPQHNDAYVISMCPDNLIFDYDGNAYHTVLIGTQCWMKENMNTTHYADGTPLVDGTGVGDIFYDTLKYWFHYNDDPVYGPVCGKLYTWSAAMNGYSNPAGLQGLCPNGWHVPTDQDWRTMECFIGMDKWESGWITEWRGTDEGGKLKETGYDHWPWPNLGATNESGFSAIPCGCRYSTQFIPHLRYAEYWTSSVISLHYPLMRELSYASSQIFRDWSYKHLGYSIRCLKE
ncbi:MAG: hypothetical protein FJY07_05180 [Bacteroidetes bacterium]|nr:hypothetical protein [Bacteroidota bacterium]MBM3435596.1 hypothetical protein [Bacteroidota bacterium]